MRSSTRIALVGLGLVFVSGVAGGQSLSWWAQCTPGAFQACASVRVWNDFDPATGEHSLNVSMSNLQGNKGFTDLPVAGLSIFQVDNLVTVGALDDWQLIWRMALALRGTAVGDVEMCAYPTPITCIPAEDRVAVDWYHFDQPNERRTIDGSLQSQSSSLLWGCDTPDEGWGAMFTSCPGTVTWRISFAPGEGYLELTNQSSVHLTFREADPVAGGWVSCTTGVDCVTVTPEPTTLVLLGTGLAGLAGWSRRRRKPPKVIAAR